ncbi:hypothetical protein ACIGB8_13860 [Promicromonospora sukumoe]|uniref:hypothetical protein n=1 Tax=Promicromonospora sukumoe TaxID=88382 RepID=UPI0037CC1D30
MSIFHVATAVTVLAGGTAAALALTGDTTTSLAVTGVTLALVAVVHLLADRRATKAGRVVLGEIRSSFGSINDDLAELRKKSAAFSDELALLNTRSAALSDSLSETSERSWRQVDSAERRLLASVDAARLEAASTRAEATRTN